jgi:hypothetical protein
MDTQAEPRPLPRLWPYLVVCGVLALWLDGGDFHGFNTADSLVPVLASLYKWTPYFWECNRIGMLVPLVAAPFQHPLTNLLVQGWLVLFAAFAGFFLLSRYALRTPSWPLVGALAAGIFVGLSEPLFCFNATFGQPHYCVAVALGLGGLLLTQPPPDGGLPWRRLPVALALLLLGVWVNSALVVLLAPLAVLRSLLRPRPAGRPRAWLRGALDGEAVLTLALLAAAAGAGHVGRSLVSTLDDPLTRSGLGVRHWPHAWAALAANTWKVAIAPRAGAFAALTALVGPMLLVPAVRRNAPAALRAALVVAAAGLLYGMAVGTLGWVAANDFCFKYWIPAVFFLETALAVVALAPLAALLRPRARRALGVLCAAALLAAVAAQQVLPSPARVRAALDRLPQRVPLPQRTAEVLNSRATHLLGTYGDVWVSVFHANLVLCERGEERRVWGVGGRSMATWDLWGRRPPEELRLAAFLDGPSGGPCFDAWAYLLAYFPPAVPVEKHPSLWLYRPADELPLEGEARHGGAVLASWHSGFFGREGTEASNARWCGSSTGKLTLTNTGDRPLAATLGFRPQTGHEAVSNLWIDSRLFCDHLLIDAHTSRWQRTFSLPPGKHILCFSCDAPRSPDPYYLRPQYFCVRNVTLSVQDYPPAAPAAP